MRPMSLLLPVSLLVLAAGTSAQTLPYPPSDAASMSSVRVSAPQMIRTDHAEHITGAYAMSNGWRLTVLPASHHIDATIDKQKPIRLVAVAPFTFTSRDGNVTMVFNRGSRGEDVVMSYVPDPRLAQVVVISSMPIAQR